MSDDVKPSKVLNLIPDAELAKALNVFFNTGAEPLVLSYTANRSALWQILVGGNCPEFEKARKNGLILVWDQPGYLPDSVGTVKTGEYLNPLVWCACALSKFPELKIAVIDHDPWGHSGYGFYKTIQAFNPENIALRIFPAPFLLKECAAVLTANSAKFTKQTVAILIQHIRALLTEHGDANNHHELASIIGPLVHMRRMGKVFGAGEKKDLLEERRELLCLFKAVGLIKWNDGKINVAPLEIENMKLVLLDDHANHGWDEWLRACVDAGKHKQIITKSSACDFIGFLDGCKRDGLAKDRRFKVVLPGCVPSDSAVLLLDIHLFPSDTVEEKKYFTDLVSVISAWKFTDAESSVALAWERIPQAEMDAVHKWLSGTGDKPADEILLTLFPRFLALLDPSLPIIVFSTTLQLPLIQKLKKYGNIFTGLNKSPFSGAQAPIEYLRENLPTIKAYNEFRKKFRDLESVPQITHEKNEVSHWEIYIDEAGKPENDYFRVAGLLVGYKDRIEADTINAKMAAEGLKWNKVGDTELSANTKWLEKVRNNDTDPTILNRQWESVKTKLENITAGLRKYSFCLRTEGGSRLPALDNPRLYDPHSLDNLYFSLLQDLLEAALFDVLETVNFSGTPTIGVYAASRVRVFEKDNSPVSSDNKEKYAAFGVGLYDLTRKTDTRPAYQALQLSGVLPVIAELLAAREGHAMAEKIGKGIIAATAVPMNRDNSRHPDGSPEFRGIYLDSPPYRHLHSVADIMASLANFDGNDYGVMTDSTFCFKDANKALFDRQRDTDEGFHCLQRISRLLDEGNKNVLVAAWLFFQMGSVTEIVEGGIFPQAVLLRLKKALETDLTGLQLQQLVSISVLSSPSASGKSEPGALDLVVQIEKKRKLLDNLCVELYKAGNEMRKVKMGNVADRKTYTQNTVKGVEKQTPSASPASLAQFKGPANTARPGQMSPAQNHARPTLPTLRQQGSDCVFINKLDPAVTVDMVRAALSAAVEIKLENVFFARAISQRSEYYYSIAKVGADKLNAVLQVFKSGIVINGKTYQLGKSTRPFPSTPPATPQ